MTALPDVVRELLDGPNVAHLATIMPDGSPHSVAVWTGLEGDDVVFFTQPESRKARNLAADPRVAFSVIDRANPYRTARIRGRVVETRTGDAALAIMDALARRYTGVPFPMRSGIAYVVRPDATASMELPFVPVPDDPAVSP